MAATVAATPLDYDAELRLGVVMYGGVSLAIYINGVTNELYELAHATPRTQDALAKAPAGTAEVYRKLSWLTNDTRLVGRYAAHLRDRSLPDPLAGDPDDGVRTRFVIDAIAGTSAGGINGLFLAKALVNDEPFAPLRDLWVQEGDIGMLLNDHRSYSDLSIPDRSSAPTSLLNSDRMYVKLRQAMDAMHPGDGTRGRSPSPWVDEMDLYVTTTDIEGSIVPLRVFDKVIHEKRHRHVFHLRYDADASRNDLRRANEPFLAFAARCTSSFPFAFEPMTLDALPRLDRAIQPRDLEVWNDLFATLPREDVRAQKHVSRAFGDGGYLDNKPFTYVVNTLSTRTAAVPVERKLVYVEPAPTHPERDQKRPGDGPPDAVSNSLAALSSIPTYETIREDLEMVLRRNRRIERIDKIVRLGELELERDAGDPFLRIVPAADGTIRDWESRTMEDMRGYYGDAFLPYRWLRVFTVTDDLADRLAGLWDVDRESDHLYALRAMVRAWRDQHFREPTGEKTETFNTFLARFDLQYRERRASFLLRKIDQMLRLVARRRRGPLANLAEADAALKDRLARAGLALDGDSVLDDVALSGLFEALRTIKRIVVETHATVRTAEVPPGSAADVEARTKLRASLDAVLELLLDHTRGITLSTADGRPIPVAELKVPSASRTLQEGVFARAQALMTLAKGTDTTELQERLERDIEGICAWIKSLVWKEDGKPAVGDALLWATLGSPRLQVVTEGSERRVKVQVGATGVSALDTALGERLRHLLSEYYLRFDSYDQMSFPLYYDTDSGEPATVEVVRVSPEDARTLIDELKPTERRRKLAGTALANFGGFLERGWRTNDIMWGRLDGAERLIAALLPAQDADTDAVRRALTAEAHRAILHESLVPEGADRLTAILCDALAEQNTTGSLRQMTDDLIDRLAPSSPVTRQRLESIVAALLDGDGLSTWVRERRDIDRRPDPQRMLENASRAVTITGRVLGGVVERQNGSRSSLRWVTRAGLAAQGLVAVSLPGSLLWHLRHHWIALLYAFELVALAIGFGLGSHEMRTAALTALAVTAGAHLATLLLSDAMRWRRRWLTGIVLGVAASIILLAGLGALAVAHLGWGVVDWVF